jgi:hypothetical protein
MTPELLGESWGTGTSPQGAGYAKRHRRASQLAATTANSTPEAREGQRASAAISRSWGCLDRLGRSAWQHSKRLARWPASCWCA